MISHDLNWIKKSLQRSGDTTTATAERQLQALVPLIPLPDWGCCSGAPAFRSLGKMKNSGMSLSCLNFPSSYEGFALHTQQSSGADPSAQGTAPALMAQEVHLLLPPTHSSPSTRPPLKADLTAFTAFRPTPRHCFSPGQTGSKLASLHQQKTSECRIPTKFTQTTADAASQRDASLPANSFHTFSVRVQTFPGLPKGGNKSEPRVPAQPGSGWDRARSPAGRGHRAGEPKATASACSRHQHSSEANMGARPARPPSELQERLQELTTLTGPPLRTPVTPLCLTGRKR